jgi:hypothetical protein
VDRHVHGHESAGLLTEAAQDDDKGTHDKTYTAAQSEQTVRLVSGELTVELRAGGPPEESQSTPDGVAAPGTNPDETVSSRDMQE